MFNPVTFNKSGFPDLSASVNAGYGTNLTPARDGMQNARGGPVYGLNSISEPNTSPDVITVAGMFITKPHMPTFIPSGTPIRVTPIKNKRDRHGEPLHFFVKLQVDQTPDGKSLSCAAPKKKGDPYFLRTFVTVTVGDVNLQYRQVQHIAVAIQNVATVFIPPLHRHELKDVKIGDKLLVGCATDGLYDDGVKRQYTLFRRYQDDLVSEDNVYSNQRVMTVVTEPTADAVKCDLGLMVATEHEGEIPDDAWFDAIEDFEAQATLPMQSLTNVQNLFDDFTKYIGSWVSGYDMDAAGMLG